MSKEAFVTQLSFHFSPASADIVPLQTIKQRLRGIWDILTWPVIRRILKADLALAIIFILLFVEPLRKYTEYGLVLAQVAVEFIYPAKSYGSVGEVYFLHYFFFMFLYGYGIKNVYKQKQLQP